MKINSKDLVLIIFITTLGLFIRISAPLSVSFPLNDGGLFYKMNIDIQANHFTLPMYTSYNNAHLPFAYPPFSFYLYALISEVTDISVIKLMQFLPSIISALTIPAFFLLAREILDTNEQAMFSVIVFAFIPRAFEWLIMGGGVTRSLGFLFTILAIRQYILLISSPSTSNFIQTPLLSGLVILTHPEASVHLIISLAFIFVWKSRTIQGLKQTSIVLLGASVISAPWWGTIITRYGIDPFFAAITASSQDSYNLITRIIILFRFNFTDEPYLSLISGLGLIGMFALLAKHKPALPIWFCLFQMIEPRGGPLNMMIPLSMFAGVALDQVLLPAFKSEDIVSNKSSLKLTPATGFI